MATLRPSLIPASRGISFPLTPHSIRPSLSTLSYHASSVSLYRASRPMATLPMHVISGAVGIGSLDHVRNAERTPATSGSLVHIRKMSTGRRKVHVKNPVVELDGDEVRLILPPFAFGCRKEAKFGMASSWRPSCKILSVATNTGSHGPR